MVEHPTGCSSVDQTLPHSLSRQGPQACTKSTILLPLTPTIPSQQFQHLPHLYPKPCYSEAEDLPSPPN
ncbi:unnamed protein product [Rodentolepis nana]|uniref:Ovule protein n=1 Tax=Rodentolepis nana TaxID=102285 RepID=A0A0R3TKC1_RODNA|nr:unnamed protein product [Rodentolepis nana]